VGNIIKLPYVSEADRDQLIQDHADKKLVEEQNLFDGNFLVFDDQAQENYIKSLEDQILLMADEASGGIL